VSPAALPLSKITVGVVVERRKATSPWIDHVWRPVGVLPDESPLPPWSVMREDGEATLIYAGSTEIELYRTETERYRDNLASGAPGVWVVLSPSDGAQPYTVAMVTVDGAEGEAYTEAADNLVEQVPMPEALQDALARFVAEHHVEREFVKRKRRRADTEALARRGPGGGGRP
jgi:hypothetical protein